ncbi:RagB/SusD family nutrient uptake outer membrane protein [Flavivirga spongiicola]|uniref:RagB/SusD family nutrient uptake outer membrane protein n=1 Tax=Flavivirga spongiicola TaxID=421621 RepID=A0ABU7XXK3_9FLAO|nr:RagB/SusD family nutrient uptake outer membrane protein [Flavivirga sp. MEBiC05379]MDO5979681.1 RagB/SusD family nutrient uptake outer membrane protein [Flavivirga sp. MEBiC05379]
MKKIKFIYKCLFCLTVSCFTSCQLTEDIDDYESLFTLNAFDAIADEASAELALVGAYSGFKQRSTASGLPELFMIPSVLSGVGVSARPSVEFDAYQNNDPTSQNTTSNLGAYTRMYDLINRCNWLIQGLNNLDSSKFDNPARYAEVLAETKALRATANFYLLRLWGQFYDVNSIYGINIRTAPALSSEAFPRNSVAETYDAITADLDEAIANAPDFTSKLGISKTYAKALKAKVLLYKGEFSQAATLAKDVIDNSGANFALASTYAEIFDNSSEATFSSSEYLFITGGGPGVFIGIENFWGTFFVAPSSTFPSTVAAGITDVGGQMISYDNNRVSSMFGFDNFKFGRPYPKIYHLRMAEVYLIFAEANARANNSVTLEALDALNAVRLRAGATTTGGDGFETYPATISLTQFLDAVRIEKMVEVGGESGEEWFDLVRFHFVDGFDVTTIKASATDPDKFILPIDLQTIEAGGNIIEQNPGY